MTVSADECAAARNRPCQRPRRLTGVAAAEVESNAGTALLLDRINDRTRPTAQVNPLTARLCNSRARWAAHDVRLHRTGIKHLRHPVIGVLHLTFEVMELVADEGLSLVAYGAECGSASEDGLRLLASWSVTRDQDADTAH